MGQGLFDEIAEFRQIEPGCDELLGYSVRQQCLEDPGNRLRDTRYTQPCLYVVNALHYYKAMAEGRSADYLAGHSLGEYNALLAAGVFDFMTGLQLVTRRGELMAEARNGAMAAVIGLSPDMIRRCLDNHGLFGLELANYNAPTQFVLSGPVDDLKRATPLLKKAGAQACIAVPVSAAFHSRHMTGAAEAFGDFLARFTFRPPATPVVSNVTGTLYPSEVEDGAVKTMLVEQMSRPVLWLQSMRELLELGVTRFIEVGPGNVLTRLLQQIRQS